MNRGAPWWLPVLQMAEAWGCHPEDIARRPGGRKWAARWRVYRNQLARVQKWHQDHPPKAKK